MLGVSKTFACALETLFVALGCALVCFASIVPKINDADKTNASHNEVPLNTDR